MKKIIYDLNTTFPVNRELGGFRIKTNIIIVDQKTNSTDHPVIKAI